MHPYIPYYKHSGEIHHVKQVLTEDLLQQSDLVVVTTAHKKVDYEFVQKYAIAIFDTKNAMKEVKNRNNIEVL